MATALTILAPLALAMGGAQLNVDIDDQSARFANVLVTSYNCELLGYGVDYMGLADWGYAIRDAMVDNGVAADKAMAKMQADVRSARRRYNDTVRWTASGIQIPGTVARTPFSNDLFGQFRHVYHERCDRLSSEDQTAAYFAPPEERLSGADIGRKLRGYLAAARQQ